jgi:Carboxypeptidase regulatory-like domain/TonB dependent receptor
MLGVLHDLLAISCVAPGGVMMVRYFRTWALSLLFAVGCASLFHPFLAWSQANTGSIAGTVTDPTGAVVAGAAITIRDLATNVERTTQSSPKGEYLVTGLLPARYQVRVTAGSFSPFSAEIEVTVGGYETLDVKLSVTATTEVQVIGAGGVAVNTQTQEMSQVVDTQQLAQLPSLTRNPYDFVALSGNVSGGDNTSGNANSGQNLTSRGVGFSINGQRESGTEILLDGVENIGIFNDLVGEQVPVDSVQEYSVITNNFAAEYGRASGGVVNVTTKSGTNNLHGTLWEFNRLSAYTANTYANDAANAAAGSLVAPKGKYTRNQFGFAVGGPIIKNKLFFFGATEWTRVRSQATETEEVLDPAFISYLPANAQAYYSSYGTGALPGSGAVTTAGQLAAAGFPLGLVNGTTPIPASTPVYDVVNFKANFDAGGDLPQNTYSLVGRLDFNLNANTQMFFRAARQSQDEFPGAQYYSVYPQYDVGDANVNQAYLYSVSHTFNPQLFDNFKASFARFNDNYSYNTALTYTPNLMLVSPTDPVTQGLIQMPGPYNQSIPGAGGLPYGGPQNTVQLEDDLSWTKGRHAMQFGGQWTYIQLNVAYGAYAQAVEQLGATYSDSLNDLLNTVGNPGGSQLVAFSARVDPQGKLPCTANAGYWVTNSPADLNLTAGCEVTPPLSPAVYGRSYRYSDWAIYAQDSFRITPQLTLNYGVRYEHYGVQHNNKANLDSNFYFGAGSGLEQQTRTGQVFIADQSPVGGFWAPSWGTVAPRVGFAYDIFGNGKDSIRGGYGISYERNFGNVTYNASFNPPASAVLNSICPASSATCNTLVTNADLGPLGIAGPPQPLPPVELRMPDPNIRTAQTQFWSLALDHQLAPNTVVEVSYSGARGVHLYDVENINLLGAGQAYLGDPITAQTDCPSPCLDRPNAQYSNINMRGSMGNSTYEALNIKVQTQNLINSGLTLVANYTYGKSLDDISSTFSDSLQGGSGYIGSLGYTDLLDPMLDWGPSDYDLRHRLTVSPIWATPWFKNGHGLMGEAAGGWTVSGIFTARTGTPFSVFDYDNVLNLYQVPRLSPATPITQYTVSSSPKIVAPNSFDALTIPVPASFAPLNPTLGISDFGPYPANMTSRNAFRGPNAWNLDMAVDKTFRITNRVGLEFRAEGFDIFNHHNFYVNTTTLDYSGPTTTPLTVTELKGGLGSLATGGNHDERRFGQFALKITF